MIHSLQQKKVVLLEPQAIINNTSPSIITIDTAGFSWLDIDVLLGATDIALTALKLQESDTDSGYADIAGANFSTGTQSDGSAAALPTATDDNKIFGFSLDLRGRKRWIKVVATVGNGVSGAFLAVLAILSRAEQVPNSKTARGRTGGEILIH